MPTFLMATRQDSTDDTLVPDYSASNGYESAHQDIPDLPYDLPPTDGPLAKSPPSGGDPKRGAPEGALSSSHYKLKRNCSSFTMTPDLKHEDPHHKTGGSEFRSNTLTQESVDLVLHHHQNHHQQQQQNHVNNFRKKYSYHKCGADNRDPRCVCSAKLGLDFADRSV